MFFSFFLGLKNNFCKIFRLGSQKSTIIRLSGPIKTHWAKSLNLDLDQLLGNGKYKEEYRTKMCEWGENIRAKDSGYFCRAAIDMYNGTLCKV